MCFITDSIPTWVYRTYTTLIAPGGKAVKGNRLQQVIDWLGGSSFDGAIIFDECHKVIPSAYIHA